MTVGFAVFPPGLPAVIQATGQLYGSSGGSSPFSYNRLSDHGSREGLLSRAPLICIHHHGFKAEVDE